MTGLALCVFGAVLFICGIAIGMNTSIGGTRSDYDDGSSFVSGAGVLIMIAGLTWELIKWATT